VRSLVRKIVLYIVLMVFAVSCGEQGIETDISRVSEISFRVLKDEVNNSQRVAFRLKEEVDIASRDFEQYLDELRGMEIERLAIQVSEYEEYTGAPVTVDLSVEITEDSSSFEFLNFTNLTIENTDEFVLYEKNAPFNILTFDQISTLERIAEQVLDKEPTEFVFLAEFSSYLPSDFVVTFYFDMVARVELN